MFVVCWFDVRGVLLVVCCPLFAVLVCCSLCIGLSLAGSRCLLIVACCLLFVAC